MKNETYKHEIKCQFCPTVVGSFDVTDERARAENFLEEMGSAIINNEAVLEAMVDDGTGKKRYEIGKLRRKIDQAKEKVIEVEEYMNALPDFELVKKQAIDRFEADIDDVRCDACAATHGSYKDMHDEVIAAGGTFEEFKEIMEKTERKKRGFDAEFVNLKETRIAERAEIRANAAEAALEANVINKNNANI